MRQLSEQELDQVKRVISAKELTSAEILVEIYDHYVSHLESFESSEFEEQLFELEQKFKYSYCHALQAKFLKASKKEIFNLQWSIFKSYFTWPRIVATAVLFSLLLLLWGNIDSRTKGITLVILVSIILILSGWIWYNSFKKVKKIKALIRSKNIIQSSLLTTVIMQLSLVTSSLNMMIMVPKILGAPDFFESTYFLVSSFSLFFIYVSYTLTLFEAWKIKSKTALI
ncbi:hypothetical protein [Algoriphagus sp.]|uniref:hypothetical protein n=1 Tax=Algoriphagus sp. TaxID=1872435 RepID=UPI003299E267